MDELQKILTEVLVVVKDGAAWSAAVAKQEIPLVVEEYLRWGLVEALLWAVVFVLVAVVLLKAGKLCREFPYKDEKYNEAKDFGMFMGHMGFRGLAALVFTLNTVPHVLGAVKILTAPRIYLLEQLSALVK